LPSFGQKLKAEREKRSITLDQISLTTKIGTRMLQALEEDKFSQLPGGIFNKGFVRAYARCVGIDEDQAVSDYLEAAGEAPRPRVEGDAEGAAPRIVLSEDTGHEARASARSRELPWGLFALALLVIAVGLSLWTHQRHEAATVAPAAAAPPSNPTPEVPARTETANLENGGAKVGKPATSTPETRTTPAGKPMSGQTAPPSPTAKVPETASESKVAGAQAGEFTVLIQGREDCWISIIADGKTLASYLLNAGDQRTVRGRQVVTIKAGNIGGVDVLFNGEKIAPQGENGEVKTLTFGPEGLQANPPTAPITQ
jgi:cytoskeleton protein RodZ